MAPIRHTEGDPAPEYGEILCPGRSLGLVGVRKVGFRLGLLIPVLISISFVFSFSSCTFDFVVGPKSTEFSVEVHHASFFCGIGVNQTYVDGQVSWFGHCDGKSWSFS